MPSLSRRGIVTISLGVCLICIIMLVSVVLRRLEVASNEDARLDLLIERLSRAERALEIGRTRPAETRAGTSPNTTVLLRLLEQLYERVRSAEIAPLPSNPTIDQIRAAIAEVGKPIPIDQDPRKNREIELLGLLLDRISDPVEVDSLLRRLVHLQLLMGRSADARVSIERWGSSIEKWKTLQMLSLVAHHDSDTKMLIELLAQLQESPDAPEFVRADAAVDAAGLHARNGDWQSAIDSYRLMIRRYAQSSDPLVGALVTSAQAHIEQLEAIIRSTER